MLEGTCVISICSSCFVCLRGKTTLVSVVQAVSHLHLSKLPKKGKNQSTQTAVVLLFCKGFGHTHVSIGQRNINKQAEHREDL